MSRAALTVSRWPRSGPVSRRQLSPTACGVGAQIREPRFVLREAGDVLVPDVGVAADGRAGPGAARVHADHVEVVEHRGGEDRRAARLLRDGDRARAARPARVEDQAADALGRVAGRQAVQPDG